MQALLAVDAGGTKCEALLASPEGELLGWGLCHADDPAAGSSWGGKGRSRESALTAIERAIGNAALGDLWVSGLGRWDVPELVKPYTSGTIEVTPVAEWDAPLALAGVTWGLVVLAGTGAFVFGRRPDGQHAHLDSLGPMLGDYGSGSMIGNLALRAVARWNWSPWRETSLIADVAELMGIDVVADGVGKLVGFAHEPHDRAIVARLASRVDAAARRGDQVAIDILCTAAQAQAQVVRDLWDKLSFDEDAVPMVAAGSVATRSALYWSHLCSQVLAFAPHVVPVVPEGPQVLGTALRALGLLANKAAQDRLRAQVLAGTPRDH